MRPPSGRISWADLRRRADPAIRRVHVPDAHRGGGGRPCGGRRHAARPGPWGTRKDLGLRGGSRRPGAGRRRPRPARGVGRHRGALPGDGHGDVRARRGLLRRRRRSLAKRLRRPGVLGGASPRPPPRGRPAEPGRARLAARPRRRDRRPADGVDDGLRRRHAGDRRRPPLDSPRRGRCRPCGSLRLGDLPDGPRLLLPSRRPLAAQRRARARASRPFDAGRDGFVLGEGAGFVVLEEREHALARRASLFAEVAGFGSACDASRVTDPHPDGLGAILAMRRALDDAGLSPGTSATSTRTGRRRRTATGWKRGPWPRSSARGSAASPSARRSR